MNEFSKYVSLDVHKDSIAVSVADRSDGEVRCHGEIPNSEEAIRKLVRQLGRDSATLSFCYEANCYGYGIYRYLSDRGIDCIVVAPSLIPRKAGDRIKTDHRDSISLVSLHRARELTSVHVQDDSQETLRDLTRVT